MGDRNTFSYCLSPYPPITYPPITYRPFVHHPITYHPIIDLDRVLLPSLTAVAQRSREN